MILLTDELAKELEIDISLDKWLGILCENIEPFVDVELAGLDEIAVGGQYIGYMPKHDDYISFLTPESDILNMRQTCNEHDLIEIHEPIHDIYFSVIRDIDRVKIQHGIHTYYLNIYLFDTFITEGAESIYAVLSEEEWDLLSDEYVAELNMVINQYLIDTPME